MSDTDSNKPEEESSEERDPDLEMPAGIAPPPMPKPDLHDIVKEGPTYGEQESKKKGKKGKKKSSHPLDNVATPGNVPKNRSGRGCCGCVIGIFAFMLLIFIALCSVLYFTGPFRPPQRRLQDSRSYR